jgi:putative tricarboxylic transport membrane protein
MKTRLGQSLVSLAVLLAGVVLALGARGISSAAGYSGISGSFTPWLVAGGLMLGGFLLFLQSMRNGFSYFPKPSGADSADWFSFSWVIVGLVLNALLIEKIGFVLSCTLCYWCAVKGLRRADNSSRDGVRNQLIDVLVGFVLAAPVFWLFSRLLKINLPALTKTGWL